MIAEENDPKQRAFLIVMNTMNVNLVANTETIRVISSKLDGHLSNYDIQTKLEQEWVNKGKGMWKVLAWVLGIVQTVVLLVCVQLRTNLADIHTTLTIISQENAMQEARLNSMDKIVPNGYKP
jgi:hypothetical protein